MTAWPKVRPTLPPEYQAIYERHYQENRSGATPAMGLAQRLESWMHRRVAADVRNDNRAAATLEIGAGTLNQLPYEPSCDPYDVVEPFTVLYECSPYRSRVRRFYADISDVPTSNRYERITSVATFEHVLDLPRLVGRAASLLARGGVLRTAVPSEGSPVWGFAWRATTGIEFKMRHGLDYGTLMRYEHVNTASEIEAVLRATFQRVSIQVLGVSRMLSLYQFFVCRDPR